MIRRNPFVDQVYRFLMPLAPNSTKLFTTVVIPLLIRSIGSDYDFTVEEKNIIVVIPLLIRSIGSYERQRHHNQEEESRNPFVDQVYRFVI